MLRCDDKSVKFLRCKSRPRTRPAEQAYRRHVAGSPNPALRKGQGPGWLKRSAISSPREDCRRHLVEGKRPRTGQPQSLLLALGQGVLVGVTCSPRSIGGISVPGSGSTLAARSVLRERGLGSRLRCAAFGQQDDSVHVVDRSLAQNRYSQHAPHRNYSAGLYCWRLFGPASHS
jgi:hypothetical protein